MEPFLVTAARPLGRSKRSFGTIVISVVKKKETTAVVILVVLCVVLAFLNENFLSARNLSLVARSLSFVGIASLGAMIVLSAGELDLSIGSCMGLAGILAAHFSHDLAFPDVLVVLCVLGVGALYGFLNGALVVGLGLNSLIVTLATGLIGRGIVYALTNGMPISGFSPGLRYLGSGFVMGVPVAMWILLILALGFGWLMSRSVFGWHIYAIGSNKEAARLSGVHVGRLKIVAFAIAGVMSALGGMLLTARLGSGEINVGAGYELDVIAAAVIGGLRFGGGGSGVSVVGILVGVAVMSVLRSALSLLDVPSAYQPIVLGSVILLAMGLERIRSSRTH